MSFVCNQRISSLLTGLLILLIFVCNNVHAYIGEQGVVTDIPTDIKEIFPAATRVGAKLNQDRVTPVYQLNEIIGYTFESDDFTNIIGFSGQTINMLIGIDPQGVIVKIKLLNHHEPIFLHGLGEQPMIRFINQFAGHSIKEHFIVDARDRRNKSVTHIDGVTKATVSVLVINDTIIASALNVARSMLEGFTRPSDKKLREHYVTKKSISELVNQGYISHWQAFKGELIRDWPDLTQALADYDDLTPIVDLYIAPISIPMVGLNMLSESEYARLIENIGSSGAAFMILDNGQYSFIGEDFVPQTAPERFKITQSELVQDSRDIDFYSFLDPAFVTELPDYNELLVLNIKGQSGFDFATDFKYQLGIDYSASFLSRKRQNISYDARLPQDLFELNLAAKEQKLPLWQRIWLDRLPELVILISYLMLLVYLFTQSNQASLWLANSQGKMNYVRSCTLLFVVGFIGVYSQGQLSVVNIYTLALSLANGFDITVFLLDPILFVMWSFVFFSLFVWGRGVFCGWLCPFGALQEFSAAIGQKLGIKQWKMDPTLDRNGRKIKYILLIGLVASAFYSLTLAEQLAEVEPFKTAVTMNFVRYWPFVLYAVLLLGLSLKIHKFYCRYLCPLGAGLAVLGAFPLVQWITRRVECGSPCQLCKLKKCSINAIKQNGNIDYKECIGCFECVVVVNQPKVCVIGKYAKRQDNNKT